MTFKDAIEAEILTNHLNVDEFGEAVDYDPITGSIFEIKVIFDDAYQGIDSESGQVINSRQPKVIARTSDLPAEPVQGDVIERSTGKRYKIAQHIPDGAGISEILLHEEEP